MEHYMTPSPMVKHEEFPEDDGTMPSLFPLDGSPGMDSQWDTPDRDLLSPLPESTPEDGEKKPKKRKSWGQVLPEPKTHLPPRKRAKTDDEKEQRRVERVLRNRRAAQTSRERKRQETEALATKNKELERALEMMRRQNEMLMSELKKAKPEFSPALTSASSPTLARDLFTPQPQMSADNFEPQLQQTPRKISQGTISPGTNDLIQNIIKTVNPAALSPAPSPVHLADDDDLASGSKAKAELDLFDDRTAVDSTNRLTQYSAVSTVIGVDAPFVAPFDANATTSVAALQPSFTDFGNFPFEMLDDLPSPQSSLIDYDHPPYDENNGGSADFFLDLFTHMPEHDGALDDQQLQQEDFASQDPQGTSHQQPQLGASSRGRDAGGNAVEAF